MPPTPLEIALERIEECRRTRSTELDLSKLGLDAIPEEVFELTWLEKLDVSGDWEAIGFFEGISLLNNGTCDLFALVTHAEELVRTRTCPHSYKKNKIYPRQLSFRFSCFDDPEIIGHQGF
jgi:hypothetical protein